MREVSSLQIANGHEDHNERTTRTMRVTRLQARKVLGGGSKPSGVWLSKNGRANGIAADSIAGICNLLWLLTIKVPMQQAAQTLHLP